MPGWENVIAGPGGLVGTGPGWGGLTAWLVVAVALAFLVAFMWWVGGRRRRRRETAGPASRGHDVQHPVEQDRGSADRGRRDRRRRR